MRGECQRQENETEGTGEDRDGRQTIQDAKREKMDGESRM